MNAADTRVDAEFVQSLASQAAAEGIARLTIGAVIGHAGKVLLLLRPESDFMPGIFELPSGKVEAGEDLLAALEREVAEETGLKVTGVEAYLGPFDYQSRSGRPTRQFNFVTSVAATEPMILTEHDDYIWAPVVNGIPVSPAVAEVLGRYHEPSSAQRA